MKGYNLYTHSRSTEGIIKKNCAWIDIKIYLIKQINMNTESMKCKVCGASCNSYNYYRNKLCNSCDEFKMRTSMKMSR